MVKILLLILAIYNQDARWKVYSKLVDSQYDEALKLLGNYLNSASREDSFFIKMEMGDIYLEHKRFPDSAYTIYTSILNIYPDSQSLGDLYYRTGEALIEMERFKEAAELLEKYITSFPEHRYVNEIYALSSVERTFKKNYYQVVARIGDYPITKLELEEAISRLPSALRKKYNDIEGKRKYLDQMIKNRLFYLEGIKMGIDRDSSALKRFREMRYNLGTPVLYYFTVTSKISVSREEIEKYYKEHKKDFLIPAKVKYQEIGVTDKKLADSIIKEIKKGTDMDTLVQLFSILHSKRGNGYIGPVVENFVKKELREVLFKKGKKNKVYGPIKIDTVYFIVKIVDKIPSRYKELEEVYNMIKRTLESEKMNQKEKEVMDEFIKETGAKFYISDSIPDSTSLEDTLAYCQGKYFTYRDVRDYFGSLPHDVKNRWDDPPGRFKILHGLVEQRVVRLEVENYKPYLVDTLRNKFHKNIVNYVVYNFKKREIREKAKVSEKEIKRYYKKHRKDEFYVPTKFRVREIVVETREEADSLYNLLQKGLSFDSLAKENSIVPTRNSGGLTGFFDKNSQYKKYYEIALRMKIGEIHPPFKTKEGWAIIKLEDKKPDYYKEFNTVKTIIRNKLIRKKTEKIEKRLFEKLKKKYGVLITFDQYYKEEK